MPARKAKRREAREDAGGRLVASDDPPGVEQHFRIVRAGGPAKRQQAGAAPAGAARRETGSHRIIPVEDDPVGSRLVLEQTGLGPAVVREVRMPVEMILAYLQHHRDVCPEAGDGRQLETRGLDHPDVAGAERSGECGERFPQVPAGAGPACPGRAALRRAASRRWTCPWCRSPPPAGPRVPRAPDIPVRARPRLESARAARLAGCRWRAALPDSSPRATSRPAATGDGPRSGPALPAPGSVEAAGICASGRESATSTRRPLQASQRAAA